MKSTYLFLVVIGIGVSSQAFAGAETAGAQDQQGEQQYPKSNLGLCFGDGTTDDPAVCMPMAPLGMPDEENARLTACADRLSEAYLESMKHSNGESIPREIQIQKATDYSFKGCQTAIKEDALHDESILSDGEIKAIISDSAASAYQTIYLNR